MYSLAQKSDIPTILGWDAAGEITALGSECTLFKEGDAVYYAGNISRPGANCEFHVVDERIVGRKPKSLSFEEAAAMPLTSITAWEALYERLCIAEDISRKHAGSNPNLNSSTNSKRQILPTVLIIGGAGGVGSIAIQLAKNIVDNHIGSSHSLPKIRVIATASRYESREWCKQMGADYVINHKEDLKSQIEVLPDTEYIDYILCLNNTDGHFESMKQLVAPQGRICSIVETTAPVDLGGMLRQKSATFVWELMFTRSLFQTYDMIAQHQLLNNVASLVDRGKIRTTLNDFLSPINAENLRIAHKKLESGFMIGKIVLSGF
jgi:alcohol dehydrogenase